MKIFGKIKSFNNWAHGFKGSWMTLILKSEGKSIYN